MSEINSKGGLHPMGRSALALALIGLVGTMALVATNALTAPRIAEQERRLLLEQLQQVMPPDQFDNAMHEDFVRIRDEAAFPGGQEVTVFRARRGGSRVGVVMRLATFDGYNGEIQLLVGIFADGTISGVRVLRHRETPGLGDGIEIARSGWIRSFDGKSLADPTSRDWAVKRDGGAFDQFTGATITPRAVVGAVHRALKYFEANRQRLLDEPSHYLPNRDSS